MLSKDKSTFIVGDVHGCFKQLLALLDKAKCVPGRDRIILLGDLVNKGPHSFKVLKWAKKCKVEVVLGNHELKFIRAVEGGSASLSVELEELKQQMGGELSDWLKWLKTWPVYIEEEDFLAIHAGLVPGEHPEISKIEWLVNIRYWDGKQALSDNKDVAEDSGVASAWHDFYTGDKLVVYAHWAKQGLKVKANSIGLDTGCVYGGKLSGVWLPGRKIVQVPY